MKQVITCCLIFLLSGCYQIEEKTTTASIKNPHEFRWKSLPRTIYNTDSTYYTHVSNMVDEWNSYFDVTLITLKNSSDAGSNFQTSFETIKQVHDNHNGVYFVPETKWPETSSHGALGVTILLGKINDRGQYIIQEADIIVRKSSIGVFDVQTILLHELGHLLGLQHQSDTDSIMYESISAIDVKRLTKDDVNLLANLYNLNSDYQTHSSRRKVPVAEGTGETIRMILELGADKTCRHLIEGKVVDSHPVELKHLD